MAEKKIISGGKEHIMLYDEEDFPIIEACGRISLAKGYPSTKLYTNKIKEMSILIGKELKGNPRKDRASGEVLEITIHKLILPVKDGMQVDHINGNKLDNRKENLREVTHQQNQWNKGLYKSNTSGYIGVSWRERDKKWRAQIKINKENRHLGFFDDPVEAARAYDKAAVEFFGKYAYLNFP